MARTIGRVAAIGLLAAASTLAVDAAACSRILSNSNGQAVVVGRTMDLYLNDHARMAANPRGVERVSDTGQGKPVRWTSRYGSVAMTSDGHSTDGMNEKGLVVNQLYLHDTRYEPQDERPALSNMDWTQYMLDNFGTVQEAVDGLPAVRIVPVTARGRQWPLHMSISDASGDSAIIEYVDGKLVLHHGREFTVMTNEPPLETQLRNLRSYALFGGSKAMPGDIDAVSRFVRAASYLKTLPPAADVDQAVADVQAIARNVASPRGAKDTSGSEGEDAWPTLWFTLGDSTSRRYFFHSTSSPYAYWVDLDRIDFGDRSIARSIDAYDHSLSGDITGRLLGKTG